MKRQNSKISGLFIYPPSTDPTIPPLSFARLKPWFPVNWKIDFIDENVSFLKYVISVILDKYKNKLIPISSLTVEDILKSIGILKSELFFDIKHYVAATSVLDHIFKLFSSFYAPAKIGYANNKLEYRPNRINDIKKALQRENFNKNPFEYFFMNKVDSYGYRDLLAISVIYSSQLIPALTLAKLYAEKYPQTLILFGGPALFYIGRDIKKEFRFIDLIAPFDGEFFIENCAWILDKLINEKKEHGYKISKINNYKDCFGFYNYKDNELDYNFILFKDYLLPYPLVSLDITRGCYYGKCVFCAYGFNIAPYRVMPINDVIKILKNLKDTFNINHYIFSVDVIDPVYFSQLSEAIIESGININYYIDARLEKRFTDKKFVQIIARSGCKVISFGLESACKKTLLRMKKGINRDYFETALKNLYENDIHVNVNLIHGFPGEKPEELFETFNFLDRNRRFITTVGISEFTLLRGSVLERDYWKYGINSIAPDGDLFLWYEYKSDIPEGYPDFNSFFKDIIDIFPVYGRLTGQTSDYLLYASRYRPDEMKNILQKAIKIKLL